jgi:DNA-binding MarR family transcriptional regulator
MLRDRSIVKDEAPPVRRQSILLQLFVLSQVTGALVDELVAESGITPNEFAVHSTVAVLGPLTPTELSRLLGTPPTTLSAIIARLVDKGLLKRRRHPEDGRSYVLETTARGRRTQERNGAALAAALQQLDVDLEGDSQAILDALHRLEAALRRQLSD